MEQPPDNAAHQQQRNEDRDQRNADRYDGEADLARALDRRLQRRGAGLEMAEDVFHHHDRVIDHEADGDGQRHQRKIVQAVTEEIDDGDGAEQRQRHRGARNERGVDAAQEQQDHQHDQRARQRQRELDVLDRSANGLGAIDDDIEMDAGGNERAHSPQGGLDVVHGVDHVGAGLLEHQEHNGDVVAMQRAERDVLRSVDGLADVADMNRGAVAIGDDDAVVVVRLGQLIVGGDGEALLLAEQRTLGGVGGGVDERGSHVLQGE